MVLPEFSYPFPLGPGARHLHAASLLDVVDEQNKHDWEATYVLSGSQHEHDLARNLAILDVPFEPRSDKELDRVEDELRLEVPAHFRDMEKPIDRRQVFHPKYAAASKLGEKLRPQGNIRWRYYDTPIGNLGVLICYDAHDPRVMLRLASMAADTAKTVKFTAILVPTFSPNDDIRRDCKRLSALKQCLVIYANTQYEIRDKDDVPIRRRHDSPNWKSHGVFFCGHDISEADKRYKGIVQFIEKEPYVFNQELDLWFCNSYWHINMRELIDLSGDLSVYSDDFKSIIGIPLPESNE